MKLNCPEKDKEQDPYLRAGPQEQPDAFPMFCTLHLSPMEGRSPAWKCADSFQSCKMKLFHPKDAGCSASCPSASLNSDQISH